MLSPPLSSKRLSKLLTPALKIPLKAIFLQQFPRAQPEADGTIDAGASVETPQTAAVLESESPSEASVAETAVSAESMPASTAGITPSGRAVNDPRVASKPVGDIDVQTAIGAVFGVESFPDAIHGGE